MEIHEYLMQHSLISINSIEKLCGITHGTLRAGKPIPEKYVEQIAGLLRSYGYGDCDERDKSVFVSSFVPKEIVKPAVVQKTVATKTVKKEAVKQEKESTTAATLNLNSKDKKYTFDGMICKYKDFRGGVHTFILSEEIVELGRIRNGNPRLFTQFSSEEFSDATIFNIVKAYHEVFPTEQEEEEGVLQEEVVEKIVEEKEVEKVEDNSAKLPEGYDFEGRVCRYKDSAGIDQEYEVTDATIMIAKMPGASANTFLRLGGEVGLNITKMYINKYGDK